MLTFEQIIDSASNIVTIKDGKEYKIENIKDAIFSILEGSYSAPSYAIGSVAPLDILVKSGTWINAKLSDTVEYLGEKCNELIFAIKPKYDFIMIYKKLDGVICDKVPMVTLAGKTNPLLKFIEDNATDSNLISNNSNACSKENKEDNVTLDNTNASQLNDMHSEQNPTKISDSENNLGGEK